MVSGFVGSVSACAFCQNSMSPHRCNKVAWSLRLGVKFEKHRQFDSPSHCASWSADVCRRWSLQTLGFDSLACKGPGYSAWPSCSSRGGPPRYATRSELLRARGCSGSGKALFGLRRPLGELNTLSLLLLPLLLPTGALAPPEQACAAYLKTTEGDGSEIAFTFQVSLTFVYFFFCSVFSNTLGPLGPRSPGPLILWSSGPLVPWSLGLGFLVLWSSGLLVRSCGLNWSEVLLDGWSPCSLLCLILSFCLCPGPLASPIPLRPKERKE